MHASRQLGINGDKVSPSMVCMERFALIPRHRTQNSTRCSLDSGWGVTSTVDRVRDRVTRAANTPQHGEVQFCIVYFLKLLELLLEAIHTPTIVPYEAEARVRFVVEID